MTAAEKELICPLLSKSGAQPTSCLKEHCAWYIKNQKDGYCAVVQIALWMPVGY